MADFKLVIANPKSGKCIQRELKDPDSNALIGKKIGEKIDGSLIGLQGYEFEIKGGSDSAGFPMRWDIQGTGRKKILAVEGVGLRKKAKGIKQRKTLCGNTIHEKIIQVNLKIIKEGSEKLFEEKKQEETKENKAEAKETEKDKAKEHIKEEPKQEVKAEKHHKKEETAKKEAK